MSDSKMVFCLARRGLVALDQNVDVAQGNLNHVQFMSDAAGRKFCLRMVKEDQRNGISDYLTELYNSMSMSDYGGVITFRSVADQVTKMKRLRQKRINVPRIVDHGDEWMLMSFAEGRPLMKFLSDCSAEETSHATTAFLGALHKAHKKGECLWDRWGANELVLDKNHVTFIDFDLDVTFPDTTSHAIKCSFDLAVAIRACLQFAQHREAALDAISEFLVSSSGKDGGYDPPHLSRTLAGQVGFYDKKYCQPSEVASASYALHKATNDHVRNLLERIEQVASNPQLASLRFKALEGTQAHPAL